MNRNYETPKVSPHWADVRHTDLVVAVAIHAIADSDRSAADIWDAPTRAEIEHVAMAVQEYIANGDFPSQEKYYWGDAPLSQLNR